MIFVLQQKFCKTLGFFANNINIGRKKSQKSAAEPKKSIDIFAL